MAGYGEQVADKAIEQTARKIRRIYTQAAKELREKMVSFNEKFAKKAETMRSELESGEITKAAYESWLRGQVFMGRQWAQKVDQSVRVMQDANEEATTLINQGRLNVFAENYNYTAYEIDKQAGGFLNFNLYDEDTVEKLIREKPKMLPEWNIDEPKDYKWNRQKVENSITQGIIQGEGIDQITDRLVDNLCTQNENRMRTFARTAMTGAQNAGRQANMEDAEDMGIKMKKRWLATLDNRTRDLHQELDGQTVDVDEPFEVDLNGEHYEIRYPGDPNAEPEMVYNCRCTMIEIYEGIDRKSVRRDMDNNEIEDMTYKEWKAMKEGEQSQDQTETSQEPPILETKVEQAVENPGYVQKATVVEGRDISEEWQRRPDEFQFEIKDVINAQGFDGKPSIVTQEEFDKAVEESGFVAQRTYSAPNQETLDAYREQLYNGDWYVDCSTGGAQYGQGMYCAADYNGELTDGIKEEMQHYRDINILSNPDGSKVSGYQLQMDMEHSRYKQITGNEYDSSTADADVMKRVKTEVREYMQDKETTYESCVKDFELPYNINKSYTETITLTPGAKILNIHEEEDALNYLVNEYAMKKLDDPNEIEILKKFASLQQEMDSLSSLPFTKERTKILEGLYEEREKLTNSNSKAWENINKYRTQFFGKYGGKDAGVVASLFGYDAINAQGHGKSGSYTVILNRTKCIFLGGAK